MRKTIITIAIIAAISAILAVGFYATMVWQFSNPKPYRIPEKAVRENFKRDELRGIGFEIDPTDQIVEAYSTDGIAPTHYALLRMTPGRIAALRSALKEFSVITGKSADVTQKASKIETSKLCGRFQSSQSPTWWTVCQPGAGSEENWIIERKQWDVKTTISLMDKNGSVFISALYPYPLKPDR